MRGRKPVPTVLRLLRGNPRQHPVNKHEPKPEPLTTACPPELTDPESIAEWHRTIVQAIDIGQITGTDRVLAITHCELWATWRSQLADALKFPHVVASGPQKHPIPNPARCMANKTLMILVRVDAELGLTPSSRSRVSVGKPSEEGDRATLAKILATR